MGQLSCEEVKISHDGVPTVTTLREFECFYHLGNNISLLIDSRQDDNPVVFIVESGSIEEREGYQRSSSIRPLAYTPGKLVTVPCSNPPCHSRSIEWVLGEWSSVSYFLLKQKNNLKCTVSMEIMQCNLELSRIIGHL